MKKILILSIVIMLILTGCDARTELYNDKDKADFQSGSTVKFEIVQLKNIMDKDTLKESNLEGGYFLFMGSINGTSTEKSVVTNIYYGYLKNKNGAIYFAQIPSNKVRIYEDADVPCIIANRKLYDYINAEDENKWDEYDMFNLHIPKGTIIPKTKLNYLK
jgi:hypothetical protein